MVIRIEAGEKKAEITRSILQALPDWFGIQESIDEYAELSKQLPFWAEMRDGKPVGFIALKETGSRTAEICVMGVLKDYHREGIGTELFNALYSYAKEHGYLFLQVKTVREGCYESYDKTNQYYKRMGFVEFECFPKLWDEHNPCQIYVMAVK